MKINAIQCLDCKIILFSRCRHDFRSCTCGNIAIDGGFDYTKITGYPDKIKHLTLSIATTKKELYDDWNLKKDKFGTIKIV